MNNSDSENMAGLVFYLFDYIFTELQKNGEITPDKCTKLRQCVLMDSKYSEIRLMRATTVVVYDRLFF